MKQTVIIQKASTEQSYEIPTLLRTSALANQNKIKVSVVRLWVSMGLMQPGQIQDHVAVELGNHPAEVFVSKEDSEEISVAIYEGMEMGLANPPAIEVAWQGHTAWLNLQLAVRADLENAQVMVSVRRLTLHALASMGQRVEVGSQEGVALLAIFGNMKIKMCDFYLSEY